MFVDSVVALNLARTSTEPTGNFQLCTDIHRLLTTLFSRQCYLIAKWIPSHEGVTGNELADKLAGKASAKVQSTAPSPGQPLISHQLARSIVRAALWAKEQERWLRSYSEHIELDHLSRIKLDVRRNPLFNVGDRFTQTTLARLRLARSDLRAHSTRSRLSDSPLCMCGRADETTLHFLLECEHYAGARLVMLNRIRQIVPGNVEMTESILLGGSEFKWGPRAYDQVSKSVMQFIRRTRRLEQ